MKTRAGRVIAWGFFALAALIASALAVCLDRVDYRPYFREPYYTETSARLRAQVATNLISNGDLSAGFGKARLTPTINAIQDDPAQGQFHALALAGYGDRKGHPATGTHYDLYVKAVAFQVQTSADGKTWKSVLAESE